MPVMLSLIRPGVFGAFLTSAFPAEFAGPPPFRPQSLLVLHVSTEPIGKTDLGLRLAIELATDCARRWPCRLTNEADGDGRRIYTRAEIIEAERQGGLFE